MGDYHPDLVLDGLVFIAEFVNFLLSGLVAPVNDLA